MQFSPVAVHACKTQQYILHVAFTDKLGWYVLSDDEREIHFDKILYILLQWEKITEL